MTTLELDTGITEEGVVVASHDRLINSLVCQPGLQAAGLRVVPYTIDREATIRRVIDLGVDGIISDAVDLLILVAKRNGLD